jgi:tetratricopeptide (TPR) repeat protein
VTLLFALLLLQSPTAQSLTDLGLEKAQQNRMSEAEQLWKQALQLDPNYFQAAFNLGFYYFNSRRPAEAAPFLERAAKSNSADFNTRYLLGAAHSQNNNTAKAIQHWRAAQRLNSRHPKLLQLLAVEYGKGRYFTEAAAAARQALALNPQAEDLHLLAIKSTQDAADHPAALLLAQSYLARFPKSPRALFELGYELHRNGRTTEALEPLNKAIQLDPNYEEPRYFLGEILLQQSQPAEAEPHLRKAIQIRKDYIAAWVALARSLTAQNKIDDAIAELKKAVAINPKHPQPHLLLSQLYFRQGDELRAAEEKALSLKLRREDPGALESAQGRPYKDPQP